MNRTWLAVALLAAMLVGLDVLAQAPEFDVRLYSIHSPSELRMLPRGDSARGRLCGTCSEQPLARPLAIRAEGDRLSLTPGRTAGVASFSGSYRIEVPGNAPLDLRLPLELRAESGRLRIVVRMPLEEYVAAVLAGEGAGFASGESLKAMAVAIRTYAMHFRGRHRAAGFDFCDTTHCQDLHLGALSERMRAAAQVTRGEILWFEGRPAAAFFHRHCGGVSEDAGLVWPGSEAPYLRQHNDPFCLAHSPATWRTEIGKEDLARALAASHLSAAVRIDSLVVVERSPSGRALRLRLSAPDTIQLRAADVRFAVGRALGWDKIPSDLYDAQDTGETFTFEGRGAGHGVGMCQAGAAEMGVRGKTYREILAFYYPGTTLNASPPGRQ
jgi:stage II sporulation protein D